jgi:hypothetical protein
MRFANSGFIHQTSNPGAIDTVQYNIFADSADFLIILPFNSAIDTTGHLNSILCLTMVSLTLMIIRDQQHPLHR